MPTQIPAAARPPEAQTDLRRRRPHRGLVAVVVLALLAVGLGVSAAASSSDESGGSGADALGFNREEERMARDLYLAFADDYAEGSEARQPFAMIASSEEQHFAAIGRLLTAYDLPDPSADLPAGTYADPQIQELYDGWLARGLTSLDEAYAVGVALEQRDIADLEATIDSVDLPDVDAVLQRLLWASERHEQAFVRASGDQAGSWGPGAGRMNGEAGSLGGMGQGSQMGPGEMGPGGEMGRGSAMGWQDCPMAETD